MGEAAMSCLRWVAYTSGEGLQAEIYYRMNSLVSENVISLWILIEDAVLAALSNRPIIDQSDAEAIALRNETKLFDIVKYSIANGRSISQRGRPFRVMVRDLHCVSQA
jgi:hypothetical protein